MEQQSNIRLGALEKLKSFREMEKLRRVSAGSCPWSGGVGTRTTRGHATPPRSGVRERGPRAEDPGRARPGAGHRDGGQAEPGRRDAAAEKGHAEVVREILKVSDVQTAGIKASNRLRCSMSTAAVGIWHHGGFSASPAASRLLLGLSIATAVSWNAHLLVIFTTSVFRIG